MIYSIKNGQIVHQVRPTMPLFLSLLLSQGYKVNHFSNTFKKFYGRHTDPVGQHKKNIFEMFADFTS